MTPADRLADLETRYLAAREAHDRLDVARAVGDPGATRLEPAAAEASAAVRAALDALPPSDAGRLADDDRRALQAIRRGIDAADGYRLPVVDAADDVDCGDAATWGAVITAGGEGLRDRLETCFASVAGTIPVGGGATTTRLEVLGRLATEPDAGRRRELFLALRPLWAVVDGDGKSASPYRQLVRDTAPAWRAGRSPVAANAAALGIGVADVEAWVEATLRAWRTAVVEPARAAGVPPLEPWDWWWRAGAAQRATAGLDLAACRDLNRRVHASLGADLEALEIQFDLEARPGRPAVPVAFTSFGARPHRRPDGSWTTARPIVLASYRSGGLDTLAELVHETGHAIHIAGIRTRPAFTDWPDSDALTEALADLVALDLAEPAWQTRWLPGATGLAEAQAIRCQYASVVLDAAWARLELQLLADPDRRPNDVWSEITSTWLGVVPHPEWSWWAVRGQLVAEPGYMANYALGAVLSTSLRAAIRDARGPWHAGDPGWYPWVRDRIYRFGLERPCGEVVRSVLGRAPTVEPLLAEIARAAGPA